MKKSEKAMELRAWHLLLEDDAYRLDWPDEFYETLMSRADELVRREIINLEEWQRLKQAAEAVHANTLHNLAVLQRDCVNTMAIDGRITTGESKTLSK